MRKLLCLMLAVLIIASVAAVSFSAAGAGTATVTLKSVKGDTVTKTYAVGETFTTYTYLNASEINSGKVGSLNGTQYYTNSVLELAEEYDHEEGDIYDVETIFPVTKSATVASGHWTTAMEEDYAAMGMGAVYYNASVASYNGFKFDADGKALIVCRYTVKAAGNATIENRFLTLACSDFDLTRIVDKGKIVNDNFTSPVALSDPAPTPTGFTLSGAITSYNTTDTASATVTVTLTGTDNNYTDTATGTTAYSFSDVPAGSYTLAVAKDNHVTREYTVAVSADTTQDVKICPIGDVSQDGKITSRDSSTAFQFSQGKGKLSDYAVLCGDVVKNDGKIASADASRIFQHSQSKTNLWKK